MKSTYISFPEQGRVAVAQEDVSLGDLRPTEVVIRNEVSIISAGTELARLHGMENLEFPCRPGYGSIGRIEAKGPAVYDFEVGARVFYGSMNLSNMTAGFFTYLRVQPESLATGLALVPLVALGLRPGHEIEHPLAVVILGGLVTSTLLNLFVVPSLYLRFGHRKRERT